MLMHAVVVHDGNIASLPVIANAIVNFVADTIENVKSGLIDVAVLLRSTTRRVFFKMHVERLCTPRRFLRRR